MNNMQAVKILEGEKSWESDYRKVDAFNMAIDALTSVEILKAYKNSFVYIDDECVVHPSTYTENADYEESEIIIDLSN